MRIDEPGSREGLQRVARVAGLLYLVVIVTAFAAEMLVRSRLVVAGDAAATARHILAEPTLYRLGGIADLVNLSCDIALAVLLYVLLRPFGRTTALVAVAFRLVADACLAGATFFHFAPLAYFAAAPALGQGPAEALAMAALAMHEVGYNVCLVFFGVHCLLLGYLLLKSALVPRAIGVLCALTGVCYEVNSVVHLVLPGVQVPIVLLLTGLVSESALAAWLLWRGVDLARLPRPAAVAGVR